MKKLLIPVSVIASLFLPGCSGDPVVNRLPWVYKIDIQQGNVFTQEQVDQLRPGMNKRQVLYILGHPMVTDPFHAERWDYVYQFEPGSDSDANDDQARLTVYFEGDTLARVEGDLQPTPGASGDAPRQSVSVVVPPQEQEDPGILTRLWRWITLRDDDA